jgi:hypothetical protein
MSLKTLIRASERNLEQMEAMRARLGEMPGPDSGYWLASAWGHAARRCAFCSAAQTCATWLAAGKVDEQYHDFCPNACFFDHLRGQV